MKFLDLHAASMEISKRILQFLRPEKTSDMIGAERRAADGVSHFHSFL
jgi:hypothetical protein